MLRESRIKCALEPLRFFVWQGAKSFLAGGPDSYVLPSDKKDKQRRPTGINQRFLKKSLLQGVPLLQRLLFFTLAFFSLSLFGCDNAPSGDKAVTSANSSGRASQSESAGLKKGSASQKDNHGQGSGNAARAKNAESVELADADLGEGGQSDRGKQTQRTGVIGVLLYSSRDDYIGIVNKHLQAFFDGKAKVITLSADEDQFKQNEQIETLIKEGVSGLAINLVDPKVASRVYDRLKKARLPVVFFNREPDLSLLTGASRACFVGTDARQAGILQGEIIYSLWKNHPEFDRNKDNKFQYIMLQGTLDNPEALARTEYSVRRAHEDGVAMEQIGNSLLANWDQKLAEKLVRTTFGAYPDEIELIIANSDAMALGALAALNEQGYNTGEAGGKYIPVIGVDATDSAIAAINEGRMAGTVEQDAKGMSEAIGRLLMNAVAGKPFLEGTPYVWDASGVALRIPYKPFVK